MAEQTTATHRYACVLRIGADRELNADHYLPDSSQSTLLKQQRRCHSSFARIMSPLMFLLRDACPWHLFSHRSQWLILLLDILCSSFKASGGPSGVAASVVFSLVFCTAHQIVGKCNQRDLCKLTQSDERKDINFFFHLKLTQSLTYFHQTKSHGLFSWLCKLSKCCHCLNTAADRKQNAKLVDDVCRPNNPDWLPVNPVRFINTLFNGVKKNMELAPKLALLRVLKKEESSWPCAWVPK